MQALQPRHGQDKWVDQRARQTQCQVSNVLAMPLDLTGGGEIISTGRIVVEETRVWYGAKVDRLIDPRCKHDVPCLADLDTGAAV